MAQNDKYRPVYMIGVAADLAGVHPQTLRMYEQKGLVIPQRTGGNTRMYSEADIERLELINELTEEGINLAGVVRILDLQGRLDARDQEIDDLHKRVRRLADRVHELETRDHVSQLINEDSTTEARRVSGAIPLSEAKRAGTALALRPLPGGAFFTIEEVDGYPFEEL